MAAGNPWVLVQHVAFEGPGSIAAAVRESGAELAIVRIDRNEPVPPPTAVRDMAGLVVMGGPMGVHDALDWLEPERALLRAAVDGRPPRPRRVPRRPATRLRAGGRRRDRPAPEVGVGEVHLTAAAIADPVFGPAPTPLPCVHWHGDTFTLPEPVRCVWRATTPTRTRRSVSVSRAYGLQFHVEVTASLVAHWAPHLPAGVFVRALGRRAREPRRGEASCGASSGCAEAVGRRSSRSSATRGRESSAEAQACCAIWRSTYWRIPPWR